jgi:hypothetical protein
LEKNESRYKLNKTIYLWIPWLSAGDVPGEVQFKSVAIMFVCAVESPVTRIVEAVGGVHMKGSIYVMGSM